MPGLRSLRNRLAVIFALIILGAIGTIYLSVTPRLDLHQKADAIARSLGHDCRFRKLYRGYAALAELRAA